MASLQAVLGNLTAGDRRFLTAVNTGAASLSLLGSGFIVLCYLLFKELRKFSFKLVFFLALSDMLCSFFSIIGDPSKGFFCYAQGYATHFFCVASFLWTTTIAFTLHRTVVRHKTDVEDLEPMFHLYVWGTSGVVTVMRSIGNDNRHISRLGVWCWAQTGRTGRAVHFVTFYAPLWGAILFNAITYLQVIRMLNNATRFDSLPDLKGEELPRDVPLLMHWDNELLFGLLDWTIWVLKFNIPEDVRVPAKMESRVRCVSTVRNSDTCGLGLWIHGSEIEIEGDIKSLIGSCNFGQWRLMQAGHYS